MTVSIARVTPQTLDLLDQIAPDVFEGRIRRNRLAACVADSAHILLVARKDGQVVGQCLALVHRHPDRATELFIDDLGVTPACRRQGIGVRLMHQAIAEGRAAGCSEIWVGAEPNNAAANALYRSLGLAERLAIIHEAAL